MDTVEVMATEEKDSMDNAAVMVTDEKEEKQLQAEKTIEVG
jgi:hypothetical protein